ncbi:MAG: hypothetical protein OHK0022_02200 [Roseiflexaceae bacterium]
MHHKEIWSFFSGAMGLDLGLEQSGLDITLAVEIDDFCCQTISKNKPDLDVLKEDVTILGADRLRKHRNFDGDVFLMVGGPPCQSFSPGGKRAGLSDPRGNLIYEYLRLIKEVRPQFFVFENVANITTAALQHRPIKERPGQHWSLKKYEEGKISGLNEEELSGSAFRQILVDIESLGYHVVFSVLDAADFGTPQHRLRFVMIGSRDNVQLSLPKPTHGKPGSGKLPFATLRDVIYNIKDDPGPHASYTPQVAHFFDLVPQGGNWRSLPKEIQVIAMGGAYYSGGGKTGFFRRLSWDTPAPTITGRANRKGSSACHPEATRPLSVKECARIQGFPDFWRFAGSMSQQYLQIGNAVPVALGRAIGRTIMSLDSNIKTHTSTKSDLESMFINSVSRLRLSARNKLHNHVQQQQLFEESEHSMIKYISHDHPLQQIEPTLKDAFIKAQNSLIELQFKSSGEIIQQSLNDIGMNVQIPQYLYEMPANFITSKNYQDLHDIFINILREHNYSSTHIITIGAELAQRLQLIQAFEQPDAVVEYIEDKVREVAESFPRQGKDIERGKNPGDVIDPYIIAAAQYLLYNGNFGKAIEATVAHKALMMIEGLLGHLHEDVIGMMRGNVRVPEPRGKNQAKIDLITNPFPGADVIQPPWNAGSPVKFYQLKSKTGSAKGGDGIRLGLQLQALQDNYGGEIYYAALLGTTLEGHRSKTAVEREAPNVVVLVGDASFKELTGSANGSLLLLRVYQRAFINVAKDTGYVIENMAIDIASTFMERARDAGEGYLDSVLKSVNEGPADYQDSRMFNQIERKSKKKNAQ